MVCENCVERGSTRHAAGVRYVRDSSDRDKVL